MAVTLVSIETSKQANGDLHVVERHTDDLGQEYMLSYFADPQTDVDKLTQDHATQLEAELAGQGTEKKRQEDLMNAESKVLVWSADQLDAVLATMALTPDETVELKAKYGG